MKAVILCGGLGTRLRPLTNTIPKAMVPIGGKPLIERHVEWLVGSGVRDIGINLFHLGEQIRNRLGDGSVYGARIHYVEQKELAGTAGDFRAFRDFVANDQCLLIYGDNMVSLNRDDFSSFHDASNAVVTVALRKWEDPTSKGIVGLDTQGRILWFKEKPKREEAITDIGSAGIFIMQPEIFSHIAPNGHVDFGYDVFPAFLKNGGRIYGYMLPGYHADIGTPESYSQAEKDFARLFPHKAVFLDRDGVLNKKPPEGDYVKSFEEFEWNENALELVKRLKQSGFKVVVVSNQRGIARGKMSKEFVDSLHKKMRGEVRLAVPGADIDGFYLCPHGLDDDCVCRKPKPGLLFHAANELSIDLSKSFMIGDSASDMEAATRAGVTGIRIQTDQVNVEEVLKALNQSHP